MFMARQDVRPRFGRLRAAWHRSAQAGLGPQGRGSRLQRRCGCRHQFAVEVEAGRLPDACARTRRRPRRRLPPHQLAQAARLRRRARSARRCNRHSRAGRPGRTTGSRLRAGRRGQRRSPGARSSKALGRNGARPRRARSIAVQSGQRQRLSRTSDGRSRLSAASSALSWRPAPGGCG